MANTITDYIEQNKIDLENARANVATTLDTFKTKNGIATKVAEPIPDFNQPNQVVYEPNTLAANRVPKANTATAVLKDTANAIGSGLVGAASGLASSAALAGSGHKMIYDMVTKGSTDVDTDLTINNTKQALGLNQAKEFLQENKSDLVKNKQALLDGIMKNTNMSETDRAGAVAGYYKDNPDMLLLDTAKVLPQSVVEMYTGGKVVSGIRGLNKMSAAARVGTATSGTVFGNAISEAADDPNNDVDARTIMAAAAKGLTVGGITGGFARLAPHGDMDTILSGMAGNSARTLKGAAIGAPVEGVEEFLGESAEKVIDNWDKRIRLDQGALAAGTQGLLIGINANVATTLPGVVGSATADVGTAIEQRDTRKNGTAEENVDITSDKFNPVRAYKDALFKSGSSNPEERAQAELTVVAASKAIYTRVDEMEKAIDSETDIATQTKLINDLIEFEAKYVAPMEAEVKNHINSVKANKAEIIEQSREMIGNVSKSLESTASVRAARYDAAIADRGTEIGSYTPSRSDDQVSTTSTGIANSDDTSHMSDDQRKTWEVSKSAVAKVPYFKEASEKFGVPMRVITAIVATESGGKFSAKSPTGAVGLLQHTGIFRKEYGLRTGDSIGVTNAAVDATVQDLAKSYKEFGNWDDAILAYNAGRGGVRSYKNGTFSGSAARKAEVDGYVGKVRGYLGGGSVGTATNSGNGFVSNDKLKGLRIKSGESIGNGEVRGYTADFAKVTQDLVGDELVHFASFNDDFHGSRGGQHPKGQAFDFSIKGTQAEAKAKSADIVKKLEASAKAQGFTIKVLNEYTNPSEGATGGHIHVSVTGRIAGQSSAENTEETVDYDAEEIAPLDIPFDEEVDITEEENIEEFIESTDAFIDENEKYISKSKRDLVSVLGEKEIEESPLYSQAQKVALRKLLGIKEKIKSGNDIDKVSTEIYKGKKGATTLESNLGIQQYEEVITRSISTNDTDTADKYLGMLDNFVDNHASKNTLIQDNIAAATRDNPLTIAPNENNEWGIVDRSAYTEAEFKKAGGLSFNGPNRLTKAIQSEANDLSDFREAMGVISSTLINTQNPVVASTVTAPVVVPTPTTPVTTTTASAPTPTAAVPPVSVSPTPVVPVNPATVFAEQDDTVDDAIYLTDDTFGFNEKNQYGLNVATDETLDKNTAAIDKVLATAETGNVMFPDVGVGAKLKANAPKTYAYLQEQLQSKLGVDNTTLLANAPRKVVPKRSAVNSKGKLSTVASNPLEPQQGSNELTTTSTVGKRGYRNNYSGPSNTGGQWSLNIVRNKSDNRVAKVVLDNTDIEGKNVRSILEFDDMMTDGDIIDQIEADNGIKQVLQQTDSSEASVDTTPELDNVKGRTFPKELRKATVIEPVIDTLFDYIESETVSTKERKLYTSIIKPILNFNPGLKIRLSETVKASSYDKSNNTIYVKVNSKGSNILQETTRMVVYSATANLAIRLQDSTYENIKAEGKQMVQLNYDLSKAKRDIERIVTLSGKEYMGLTRKEKARLLDALSSNEKLLGAVVSDPAIGKFLRSVSTTEGKVKSSLFRKITNSLRTFFNIASNDQISLRIMRLTSNQVRVVKPRYSKMLSRKR